MKNCTIKTTIINKKSYFKKLYLYINTTSNLIIGISIESHQNQKYGPYPTYLNNITTNINSNNEIKIKKIQSERSHWVFSGWHIYYKNHVISGIKEIIFASKSQGPYASLLSLRLNFLAVGLWWFLFSCWAFYYLKKIEGPKLPKYLALDAEKKRQNVSNLKK